MKNEFENPATEETDGCPFCKELNNSRKIVSRYQKEDYETKFCVALVNETYFRNEYTGKSTFYGYELNFCPECGKKINKEKIKNAK